MSPDTGRSPTYQGTVDRRSTASTVPYGIDRVALPFIVGLYFIVSINQTFRSHFVSLVAIVARSLAGTSRRHVVVVVVVIKCSTQTAL